MDILGIITLITAILAIFFKVTKNIDNSLVFFSLIQTNNTRLKDDSTDTKTKDLNAFTFSIIIVFFSFYLMYRFKFDFLWLVLILIGCIAYIIVVMVLKDRRIMSVTFEKKEWYLHGKLDDSQYLLRNLSSQKRYDKLKIVSKTQIIDGFSGYVDVNNFTNKVFNYFIHKIKNNNESNIIQPEKIGK